MRVSVSCFVLLVMGGASVVFGSPQRPQAMPVFDIKNAKAYEGASVGVGGVFSLARTTCDANRHFSGRSATVNSVLYGGAVSLGYQRNISGNFFIGAEVGADLGITGKRAHVGGGVAHDSWLSHSDYLDHVNVLNQMFRRFTNSLKCNPILLENWLENDANNVDGTAWQNFLRSMRYLGGNTNSDLATLVVQDNTPGSLVSNFMFDTTQPDTPLFSYGEDPNQPQINRGLSLVNFIGANTIHNIRYLGGDNLPNGFRNMREFITSNYPNLTHVLSRIGESDFYIGNLPIDNTSIDNNNDLSCNLSNSLYEHFLANELGNLRGLGLNDDNGDVRAGFVDELNSIYYPDLANIPNNYAAPGTQVSPQVRNKTFYGICPNFAVKLGSFVKVLNACLYTKVGVTLLKGSVMTFNNQQNVRDEKFNKYAFFVAFGVSKMIDQKWGVSAEISHAFKVTKKLADVEWGRYKIENKVKLQKTSFKIILTYKI